jgi:hypothetical protein
MGGEGNVTIIRKQKQVRAARSRHRSSSFIHNNTDAGFDSVYNRQLRNALLRNIIFPIDEARFKCGNWFGSDLVGTSMDMESRADKDGIPSSFLKDL